MKKINSDVIVGYILVGAVIIFAPAVAIWVSWAVTIAYILASIILYGLWLAIGLGPGLSLLLSLGTVYALMMGLATCAIMGNWLPNIMKTRSSA